MQAVANLPYAAEIEREGSVTGTAPGWPLGLARIVTGWLWATQLMWKMPPTFGCVEPYRVAAETGGGLCDWVGREIAYPNPYFPWFADLLAAVVAPNLGVAGWLIWLAVAGILWAGSFYEGAFGRTLYAERSFFGVHRVTLDTTGPVTGSVPRGIRRWSVTSLVSAPTVTVSSSLGTSPSRR